MDFLDPKEQKNRTVRLFIGYGLMTVLIFIASLILVYQSYGFGVDKKTGEVVQNGLLYIDSAPDKANIFIDDVEYKASTNTRISLKAGVYKITLRKDGYRDWNRKVEIVGGGVLRFTYPMLLQTDLAEEEVQNFGNEQTIRSQSPDRRWIMVTRPGSFKDFTQLDMKDVKIRSGVPVSTQISFPEEVFSKSSEPQTYEITEWANDNLHFVVKHTYGASSEYVVLNRDRPETSFSVNKLIGRDPTNLTLRNKKFDRWNYQDKTTGDLFFATAKKEITELVKAVGIYKTHDDNVILYTQKNKDGEQNIYLRQDNDTRLLSIVTDGVLALDLEKFDGDWFVVYASESDKKTYVYKNPWDDLQKADTKPAPKAIFHTQTVFSDLKFSANTRFVFVRDGQHFGVYDAEQDRVYKYDYAEPIDPNTPVKWMDGHRLLAITAGKYSYVEYDGNNKQTLVSALPGMSVFFDRDYTSLYALQPSKKISDSTGFILTDLRYQQDK